MPEQDQSSVFHIAMLDNKHRAEMNPELPWIFEGCETGFVSFGEYATEEEACAAQREYRAAKGFDPITGEPA